MGVYWNGANRGSESKGDQQIRGKRAENTPYWEAGVRESISHKAGLAGGNLPIELCRHPG